MNAFRRISVVPGLVALTAVVLSSGCASSGSSALTDKRSQHGLDKDQAYIAAVEHLARRRGVGVQWVNPPNVQQKARVR